MVEYVTKTENGNKFDYAQWTSDYKGWLRNKEILKSQLLEIMTVMVLWQLVLWLLHLDFMVLR